jgi:hypothetical protein
MRPRGGKENHFRIFKLSRFGRATIPAACRPALPMGIGKEPVRRPTEPQNFQKKTWINRKYPLASVFNERTNLTNQTHETLITQ